MMSLSTADQILTPPAARFSDAFPFHLVLDWKMQVCQVGHVIERYLPDRWQGSLFTDLISLKKPHLEVLTIDAIRAAQNRLWQCETHSGLMLRGSWQLSEAHAFFLCTAWVADLNMLDNLNLKLRDFPIHDASTDHLMLIQQQRLGLTEQQALTEQLRMQKNRAEQASKAKSVFLTSMSHEIRTPMNGIMGMTQLLMDSGLDNEQQNTAKTIASSASHLLAVINDILDLAQFESGEVHLQPSPCQPDGLIQQALDICAWSIEDKNIQLTIDTGSVAKRWIELDAVRLTQVLVNLIGNAVKFTQYSGQLTIRCAEVNDKRLLFEVIDNGIGMETPEKMFEPFSRATSETNRCIEGTGLGLAICQKIITQHQGDIGAISELGKGSTVWFELPLVDTAPPAAEMPASMAKRSLAGSVLLVEDNEVNQRVGCAYLVALGLVVTIAKDGQEAVDTVSKQAFDLILMDCQMPIMNGFVATRTLRASGVTVPIIALTADVLAESHDACLAAGMNAVLTKPIQRESLGEQLDKWLNPEV